MSAGLPEASRLTCAVGRSPAPVTFAISSCVKTLAPARASTLMSTFWSVICVFSCEKKTVYPKIRFTLSAPMWKFGNPKVVISKWKIRSHAWGKSGKTKRLLEQWTRDGEHRDVSQSGSRNISGMNAGEKAMSRKLVGARGFEPLTPCAQGRCATRLRYAPTD